MNYKLIERGNPGNAQAAKKWYASPVKSGKTVTLNELAVQISGRSSLTRGDVNNTLQNVVDELPLFLMMGRSVQLGDFGTLRLSFGSDGVEDPKNFNTNMIRGVKVIFTPGKLIKKGIEDLTFEIAQ
jgi:predicted histone-like DNA-binding protein